MQAVRLADYRETRNGQVEPLPPGTTQGVHIIVEGGDLQWLVAMLEEWFERREDVTLIGQGELEKTEDAYLMLEWGEHTIDPLFAAILDHEDRIHAYSIYTQEEN